MLSRRQFLLASAASLWLAGVPPGARASQTGGRLILVFLRGGLDGLFVFSPNSDPRLPSLRPQLAQRVLEEGIPLVGTGFSAHPAARPLAQLFEERQLAFAPSFGSTDRSRSHFQAQDIFELGTGASRGNSGLLARASDWLGKRRGGISFTGNLPLSFQGARDLPGIAPPGSGNLTLKDDRTLAAIRAMHAQLPTGAALEQALQTQNEIEAAMTKGMDPKAARNAAGVVGFPEAARIMARVLRENPHLALAFLDLGGFDTHAAQESTLNRNLELLAGGLLNLREDLGEQEWRRTQVLVCTEFGRTVRENGTQGTDHGHGSLALLLGGAIDGGRQIGDFGGLADSELNENRDLPTRVDWRSLLGRALHDTLGIGQAELQKILPGMPGLV